MSKNQVEQSNNPEQVVKRAYTAPQLVQHGAVEQVTQQSISVVLDG